MAVFIARCCDFTSAKKVLIDKKRAKHVPVWACSGSFRHFRSAPVLALADLPRFQFVQAEVRRRCGRKRTNCQSTQRTKTEIKTVTRTWPETPGDCKHVSFFIILNPKRLPATAVQQLKTKSAASTATPKGGRLQIRAMIKTAGNQKKEDTTNQP